MELSPETLVPRLGEYLLAKGLVTEQDLRTALMLQESTRQNGKAPRLLGNIMMEMGAINRADLDGAITEQLLELRNALLQAQGNLQQQVADRTKELASTLAKLENLNKLQIRFVSHISHEFRTPLYHLAGYLELLSGGDMGTVNQKQREALDVMQRASDRLGVLIEDLILFTATADRPLQFRFRPEPVRSLCESVLIHVREAAEKGQIEFVLDCPLAMPSVKANDDKLVWVIRHLIENGIKFTNPGGSVALTAKEENGFVVFTVRDTGIGIPEEHHEDIFEPFRQLDHSASRRYGGMGLGLTLARKIIQAHGDDIAVTSAPGKGASFSFRLPAVDS